jgi:predicted cobalt transporter CbtA
MSGKFMVGLVAGLLATVVLSALMAMKTMMHVMPALDIASMLSAMMGAPGKPALGWMAHFMIGSIGYGLVFAAVYRLLPGQSPVTRGVLFGLVGWLVMMIAVMPMAGMGLFAFKLGIMAPVMTAILHAIFGAVLGWSFAKFSQPERVAA